MSSPASKIASRPPASGIVEHVKRTLQLALPVMAARVGLLLIVAVDSAMSGLAGVDELAAYALSVAPLVPMLLFGIGLLMGTLVLGAQADGAGEINKAGWFWRISLGHALVVGLGFALLSLLGEQFLLLTGQNPELAEHGASVLHMQAWGIPAMLMFATTSFFLEGIGRPGPGAWIMLIANVLNIALNWVFIYGHFGAPVMGAEGAALASSIVRWFMFISLAVYALKTLDHQHHGISGDILNRAHLSKTLLLFGAPLAIAHTLESGAFAAMILFAGLVGKLHVAAYQLAFNIVATTFMAALGLAAAASIRVANAKGRRDPQGMKRAGWVAVAIAFVVLLVIGLCYAFQPEFFARLYSHDPEVLAIAIPCILMAAMAIIPDGIQGVLMGSLRGAGDIWPATLRYCLSFWGIMVPAGYYFGVINGGGAPALVLAIFLGTSVATLLLAIRFIKVSNLAIANLE